MKHPEYDSPFEFVISDITTQMARNIDEMCWNAVQRVGINVNKDKLLTALEYDSARYREAFRKGEETGYTKRDEEIVRCKDCRYGQYCTDRETTYQCFKWNSGEFGELHEQDWFCADGKRRTEYA